MLVLGRYIDESIYICYDPSDKSKYVELKVVDIRGDKVRLGFNAPKDMPIHRKEVYEAILREESAASQKPLDTPGDLENKVDE